MRSISRVWFSFSLAVAPLVFAACGEDSGTACVPGRSVTCACQDGAQGVQICSSNGTFAECVCGALVDTGVGEDPDVGTAEERDAPIDLSDVASEESTDDTGTADEGLLDQAVDATGCDGPIEVSPGSVNFGVRPLNVSTNMSITLTPCGVSTVEIGYISLEADSSPAFAVEDLPVDLLTEEGAVALESGESLVFVVRYTPSEAQRHAGRVLIEHAGGVIAVVVTGVGEGAPMAPEPGEGIFIVMTWATEGDNNPLDTGAGTGSDMDLHLLHPMGTWDEAPWDCHWKNQNPNWGDASTQDDDPNMLVDDTDGWGPEIIALELPEGVEESPFVYKVGALYYFRDDNYGPSDVTIQVFIDTVKVFTTTFEGLEDGQFWDVARIDWPSREVERIDRLYPGGFPEE